MQLLEIIFLGRRLYTSIVDMFMKENNLNAEELDLKTLTHIIKQAEECKKNLQ